MDNLTVINSFKITLQSHHLNQTVAGYYFKTLWLYTACSIVMLIVIDLYFSKNVSNTLIYCIV